MKDKLSDLLSKCLCFGYDDITGTYYVKVSDTADRLIENGVTIQKWISVKDRLPDTFGEFIVCVQNADGRRFSDYADFDPYVKKWKTGLFCGEHDKVTHWMPMPEPPSESTVTVEDECNDEDWGA